MRETDFDCPECGNSLFRYGGYNGSSLKCASCSYRPRGFLDALKLRLDKWIKSLR